LATTPIRSARDVALYTQHSSTFLVLSSLSAALRIFTISVAALRRRSVRGFHARHICRGFLLRKGRSNSKKASSGKSQPFALATGKFDFKEILEAKGAVEILSVQPA
jgi:hypothetical protein